MKMEVRFAYNRATVDAVKLLPSDCRAWNQEKKCWIVEATEVYKLANLVKTVDPVLANTLLNGVDFAVARSLADKARQHIEASRATDANIDIPLPSGLELYGFQKAGVAFMAGKHGVLLADDMGLGKTPQCLALINKEKPKKVLAIVKNSIKINWAKEARRWLVDPWNINIFRAAGKKAFREFQKANTENVFYIINYDLLKKYRDMLLGMDFDLIVADECHYIKNYRIDYNKDGSVKGVKGALRAKISYELFPRAKKVIFATGTPIVNRPVELWPMIHALDPQTWNHFFKYALRYCTHEDTLIWMGNFLHKKIKDIVVGDEVIGWEKRTYSQRGKRGGRPKETLVKSTVLEIKKRIAHTIEVTFESGRTVVCTPDHLWKNFNTYESLRYKGKDYLFTTPKVGIKLVDIVLPSVPLPETDEYKMGYIKGALDGDGVVRQGHYKNGTIRNTYISLRVKSADFAKRYRDFAESLKFSVSFKDRTECKWFSHYSCSLLGGNKTFSQIISFEPTTKEELRGWLAGMYDAEGHGNCISQDKRVNTKTHKKISDSLKLLGFGTSSNDESVFISGGKKEVLRFFQICNPACSYKFNRLFLVGRFRKSDKIVSIKQNGKATVVSMKTTSGNYVAGGYASKNCDATQGRFGWDFGGASNLPELQERLRSNLMVRRLKGDVLKELPPKVRQVIEIEPEGEDMSHEAKFLPKKGEDFDAGLLFKAGFEEMSAVRHETALKKLPYCLEFIEDTLESKDKVIVFAHHRELVEQICAKFQDVAVKILGGDSDIQREKAIESFQKDPKVKLFVGSMKACGEGITLTAADTVIFCELDWVPSTISQCEDRAHRIGQVGMVNVYHLVFAESIDYYLAHVLVQKQAVIDEAMNIFPEGTIDLASLSAEVAEQEVLIKAAQEEAKAKIPAMPSFSKNVPEIAAVEKEYILQMLRYLAGVCDGAARRDGHGFNKFDAQFGRGMAGFENLTDRQALFAKKLLVKYRKQLSMVFPAHVIDLSFSETFMAQFGGDQAELI